MIKDLLEVEVFVLVEEIETFLCDFHDLGSLEEFCSLESDLMKLNQSCLICFLATYSSFLIDSSELKNLVVAQKREDVCRDPQAQVLKHDYLVLAGVLDVPFIFS